jgi:predicted nuclease of predicted toxin-antitoxin system
LRFLINEDLPKSTIDLFHSYGHDAVDIRNVGLRGAKDSEIAYYARSRKRCLVTGDTDFSNIRNYPPAEYHGIVVLRLPRDATADWILGLLRRFLNQNLNQKKLIAELPGKLAIVEAGRIRIRKS